MTVHYHHSSFDPCACAAQASATVTVIIPTRNESATIAPIVTAIRQNLVEMCPLVSEIIVADNGSTDNTAHIAREAGAQTPTLRDDGTPFELRGKGWALQRAVEASSGDIIICIDADIKNFDTRFVAGLAGPLLFNPLTEFAKAFYTRPFVTPDTTLPSGGGRVTELVVRPMLSLFYPALAHFQQPLSGEYAFRRSLAERLPFWSGYGVEVGILLHILRSGTIEGVAEVDMDERIHRNRPVAQLGRMSLGILKTLFYEMTIDGIASLTLPIDDAMLRIPDTTGDSADIARQILLPAIRSSSQPAGGTHA